MNTLPLPRTIVLAWPERICIINTVLGMVNGRSCYGQLKCTIYDVSRLYHSVLSQFFCQIRQICGAYNSLRCLDDLQSWRYFYWQRWQPWTTTQLITLPLVHAHGVIILWASISYPSCCMWNEYIIWQESCKEMPDVEAITNYLKSTTGFSGTSEYACGLLWVSHTDSKASTRQSLTCEVYR